MKKVLLSLLLSLLLPPVITAQDSPSVRIRTSFQDTTALAAPRSAEQDPPTDTTAGAFTVTPSWRWAPALTTNLLYDLGITPNLGMEFPIGRHWSIAATWHYAWWYRDEPHYYWQTYGGALVLRYWLSDKKGYLTGHHFGVYGQMLTYDFEFGGRGEQAAKWQYGGGLEYGYSFRLNRVLRLDLHLGVGYLGGRFERYDPVYGYYVWKETVHRRWFGPTWGGVTLVWLLQKKEGGR